MEEQVPHVGLRAQKILPPGERPGILAEPGPQRSDRSRRHFSGDGLPQLALPLLASSASEALDASALAFLLSQSLAARKHEEQKKREKEAKEALLAWSQRRGKVKGRTHGLDGPRHPPHSSPVAPDGGACGGDRSHQCLEVWLLLGFFFYPEEEEKEEEVVKRTG